MLLKDGREVRVCFTGAGGDFPIRVPDISPEPAVCVTRMAAVAGIDHIPEGHFEPGYDVWIVNLFAHQNTVIAIKELYPEAKVIVRMDSPPEHGQRLDFSNAIRQVQAADLIADTTWTNASFYAGLLGKPYTSIPSPIGPTKWFEKKWNETRAAWIAVGDPITQDDFILTLDHIINSEFHYDMALANVAAVTAIQRETGLKVVYASASEATKYYAKAVGLEAQFLPQIPFEDMLELAMKAVLSVDMYLMHTEGRHETAMAAIGLPTIAGDFTPHMNEVSGDPYDAMTAMRNANALLENRDFYKHTRQVSRDYWQSYRSDEAVKKKVLYAVEQVMEIHELALVE
jgi:hypothetical protein